jgi:pimeloyl-ACP methyl ester carboxylesterase
MSFAQAENNHPIADLESLAAHVPTLIVAGSKDRCTQPLQELLPSLQSKGKAELEIVEDIALYGTGSAIAQETIRHVIRGWVHRTLETAGSDG